MVMVGTETVLMCILMALRAAVIPFQAVLLLPTAFFMIQRIPTSSNGLKEVTLVSAPLQLS